MFSAHALHEERGIPVMHAHILRWRPSPDLIKVGVQAASLHCMALLCIWLDYVVVFGPFFFCLVCGPLERKKTSEERTTSQFNITDGLFGPVELLSITLLLNSRQPRSHTPFRGQWRNYWPHGLGSQRACWSGARLIMLHIAWYSSSEVYIHSIRKSK